mgnify:CR=1 FL=1
MIRISNIEKFATHDGPGIRTTVFLKGCFLHCPWCANPETWKSEPVLMHDAKKCVECKTCMHVCERGAISFPFQWDMDKCIYCKKCENYCLRDAISFAGKDMEINEVIKEVLKDKDYFVLTTNVDHQFQKAGFDKQRLFYTQGDYGLFQCSKPCHRATYDNEEVVREMVKRQKDMKIPTGLIPHCPVCGKPMTMNLRADDTFVQDDGWYRAAERYADFLRRHKEIKMLLLELGVGMNTPGIIKYPFWQMAAQNPNADYVSINAGEAYAPEEIRERAICVNGDIGEVICRCH